MSKYAVMPLVDYVSACDVVREKTGTTDIIKSGELAEKINGISGNTDLTELLTLQESYIYGGVNDVLHLVGFEQTADGDYITGYIPHDSTYPLVVNTKNIVFADDEPILFTYDGTFGNWVDREETDIVDLGCGKFSISPLTDDPFTESFRLKFRSYRFNPIITLGGDEV